MKYKYILNKFGNNIGNIILKYNHKDNIHDKKLLHIEFNLWKHYYDSYSHMSTFKKYYFLYNKNYKFDKKYNDISFRFIQF